jgi:hypothetical protein
MAATNQALLSRATKIGILSLFDPDEKRIS